ncbi:DUF5977 domain-containing protein [Pedobacter sp. MC2016-05]|uniref:DUF5977 domain-containing protein n=1 Tax=Pedobacter sp. MC2016-05 TaxID=2994474 RepID=UPI00224787A7|nr:DUF5977 domain-containing protein [Pedobacter sp. MC2016-05]MCX2474088.1 DUF5977 domain-containing protein [Pedobacter sp. MC2016-05]
MNQSIYLLGNDGSWGKLDIEDLSLAETTFSISDINDITARKDTVTTNITIKATKNNNRILGNIYNLNVTNNQNNPKNIYNNFNLNGDVECLLFENDSLICKGLFKIIEVMFKGDVISYECMITGYRNNFFSKLGDKLLSDLDFTEFNHQYSVANILNNWGGDVETGKGYVYGLADYGNSTWVDEATVNNIEFKNLRPSFFLNEYFKKIFAQTDYSFEVVGSNKFKSFFNSLVVPNNSDVLANFLKKEKLTSATKTSTQRFRTGKYQTVNDSVLVPNIKWDNVTKYSNVINMNDSAYLDYTSNVFLVDRDLNTSIEVSATIQGDTDFLSNGRSQDVLDTTITMHVMTRPNDQTAWNKTASSTPQRIHTDGMNWRTGLHKFKLKSNLVLPNGGQMYIAFECTDYHTEYYDFMKRPKDDMFYVSILPNDTFINIGDVSTDSKITLELNDTIDFKNNQSINTYKQQDFIKSIMALLNLMIYTKADNPKHIIFETYNDFYSKCLTTNIKGNAVDWSSKMDFKELSTLPFANNYKSYNFTYKDDADYLNKYIKDSYGVNYGSFKYKNANGSTDKSIEVIFAPTPIMGDKGKKQFPAFYQLDNNNNKVAKQTVIRLLAYNGTKSCDTFNVGKWFQNPNDNNNWTFQPFITDLNYYIQLHHTHDVTNMDLNFNTPNEIFYTQNQTPDYIYPSLYFDQIREFNDSNTAIVDARVLVNEIDVANLDFKTPIYFDSPTGDGYFKLIKLEYGSSGTSSIASFQKIFLAESYGQNTFENKPLSKYITNSNCTTSESRYITIPAGKYTSLISQLDADNLAQAEFNELENTLSPLNICVNTGNSFQLSYSDTNATACSIAVDGFEYYTQNGGLANGDILFKKTSNIYLRCNKGFYSNSTNWYAADENGQIYNSGSCNNVGLNEVTMAYSITKSSSCNYANQGIQLDTFFFSTYLNIGEKIYSDNGNTPVGEGWYSDAYYSYQTDSTGTIINQQYC